MLKPSRNSENQSLLRGLSLEDILHTTGRELTGKQMRQAAKGRSVQLCEALRSRGTGH